MTYIFPEITATRFDRIMGSGRTQPCLMVCEDAEGEEIEVVVKLRKHPQIAPGGLLCEAFSALLAMELDLPVSKPYRVLVTPEFSATLITGALSEIMKHSVGLNFGSAKWQAGTTIWAKDKQPNREQRGFVEEIYAFDAITQNPDRRSNNPNCAFLGSDIMIFDHEQTFSHFLSIVQSNPWEENSFGFLSNHLFGQALRGGNLKLDRLQGALAVIDADRINAWLEIIPKEWEGDIITGKRIKDYLLQCIENFDKIHLQLEKTL